MEKTGLLFLWEEEVESYGVTYEVYENLETGDKVFFEGGLTAISGK